MIVKVVYNRDIKDLWLRSSQQRNKKSISKPGRINIYSPGQEERSISPSKNSERYHSYSCCPNFRGSHLRRDATFRPQAYILVHEGQLPIFDRALALFRDVHRVIMSSSAGSLHYCKSPA